MTSRGLFAGALAALSLALALAGPVAGVVAGPVAAESGRLTLATTTTTENSGLMAHLLPIFEASTGIRVRVVVRGTGQVLRTARDGDVDAFIAHDKAAELAFVDAGFGVERRDIMYNDFVLVGPADDPAGIRGFSDAARALSRIAATRSHFVSRADDSGTHRAERRLWRTVAVDPVAASGTWYLEAGAGMGTTLNIAAGKDAYTLTDRGTWLAFRNRRGLQVLVQGDKRLVNQYGITLVNPERHPYVRAREGRALINWLSSDEGRRAIADYRIDGRQLFFPNEVTPGS